MWGSKFPVDLKDRGYPLGPKLFVVQDLNMGVATGVDWYLYPPQKKKSAQVNFFMG